MPLIKKFEWEFDRRDPTILRKNGKKVAWLEKLMGPIGSVGSRYDRQSVMQRWVCEREALDGVLKAFPQFIIKERFEVEKMEYKKTE